MLHDFEDNLPGEGPVGGGSTGGRRVGSPAGR